MKEYFGLDHAWMGEAIQSSREESGDVCRKLVKRAPGRKFFIRGPVMSFQRCQKQREGEVK